MKNLNQKGAVDLMFVAVLIVLVAAAAFTLWKVNQADETVTDTANNTANQSTIDSSEQESNTNLVSRISYDTPEGWMTLDCTDYTTDSDQVLLAPSENPATECDDREDVILVDITEDATASECTEQQSDPDEKGNSQFSCTESERDGIMIVNNAFVRPDNTWANSYDLFTDMGNVHATFITYYPEEETDSEYIAILEQLVSTVEFK